MYEKTEEEELISSQIDSNNSEISNLIDLEFSKLSSTEQEDIKKIVNQTFKENLSNSECFFSLNERLDYILGMDTMKFVKKVMNFYKQNIIKYDNENINNIQQIKKITNGKEVIFNDIPETINEDKLKEFCEKLGEIEFIKRLNNIKYIVKFKEEISAFAAVDYRGPIFGVFLKKYFNNFSINKDINNNKDANNKDINNNKDSNNKKVKTKQIVDLNTDFFEKILEYLRKQDVVVDKLYINGFNEIANELNEIKNEIKTLILKSIRK